MPNLMDLPREVRDLIFAQALFSDHVLVVANGTYRYPERSYPKLSVILDLLQVNKQVYTEATAAFFSVNIFDIWAYWYHPIYIKNAKLIRKVKIELAGSQEFLYYMHTSGLAYRLTQDQQINSWKRQIRELAQMSNLQLVQIDVGAMNWSYYHPDNPESFKLYPREDSLSNFAKETLKPILLAVLPQAVRHQKRMVHRGFWITGHCGHKSERVAQLHEVGKAWREIGVNVLLDESASDCWSPLDPQASLDKISTVYYG